MNAFRDLDPIVQALIATCFTWAVTAAGAALVFFAKEFRPVVMDSMLGFAAGIMIAASYWSLLAPAIQLAGETMQAAWVPAVVGFLAGGAFLLAVDKLVPHVHPGFPISEAEGVHTSLRRSVLLVLAITIHNIPEGLAVGVAFGAAAAGLPGATLGAAIALGLGIGIQNFPEGAAVSMPLRRDGLSRRRSFWWGQLSGVVEPIAGVVGAAAVLLMQPLLPYALGFAAGAMIFVVAEELIPEAHRGSHSDYVTMSLMVGFALMMVLDVALG
ncbi:MAG TPA: ZIP family metal transporter [Thermoleophilia bacterium]|nr:ZIP family metal transporter [Thermoleophilia bacterium]